MIKEKNKILILAGGKGKRMGQDIPKALTKIAGESIIFRLLKNTESICKKPALVVGHCKEQIMDIVNGRADYIFQDQQLGTGNAVYCAKEKLEKIDLKNLIVIPGDHPLISKKTIEGLIHSHDESDSVITISIVKVIDFDDEAEKVFFNCGRIIRNGNNEIIGIVELKDASEEEQKIKEINASYYCFDAEWLWVNIPKIKNNNKAKEYYLTDLVKIAKEQGDKINGFLIEDPVEGMGVNTPEQKLMIENILKKRS